MLNNTTDRLNCSHQIKNRHNLFCYLASKSNIVIAWPGLASLTLETCLRFLGVARHCGFCHYSQRKIWRASLHCMGWSSRRARMRISDPAKVTCMHACSRIEACCIIVFLDFINDLLFVVCIYSFMCVSCKFECIFCTMIYDNDVFGVCQLPVACCHPPSPSLNIEYAAEVVCQRPKLN